MDNDRLQVPDDFLLHFIDHFNSLLLLIPLLNHPRVNINYIDTSTDRSTIILRLLDRITSNKTTTSEYKRRILPICAAVLNNPRLSPTILNFPSPIVCTF